MCLSNVGVSDFGIMVVKYFRLKTYLSFGDKMHRKLTFWQRFCIRAPRFPSDVNILHFQIRWKILCFKQNLDKAGSVFGAQQSFYESSWLSPFHVYTWALSKKGHFIMSTEQPHFGVIPLDTQSKRWIFWFIRLLIWVLTGC